jgi:hypothetical protein
MIERVRFFLFKEEGGILGSQEKKLVLGELLEREIALYAFENKLITEVNSSNRKYEEAQKRYEEAQKRYEEAQKRYEAVLASRIWRYTWVYRRTSSWIKSRLKQSVLGRSLLRVVGALVR